MAILDFIIKAWDGTEFVEAYPKTTHTQIIASGTPNAFSYLRGDGVWSALPANALNVAGYVAAPTAATINKVWKTDDLGNPAWRDEAGGAGVMTSTTDGIAKLFSDTVQSVAANAVSTTASRTYGIQVNASGQLVVNVPWEDTNTVYTHPTYSLTQTAGTETTLTDITLIDSLTINSTGHLTGATWRKLVAGSNVTITPAADGNITISSTDNNTLNTAGSTDISTKIFLVGASSQAASAQTYSDNEVFATNGVLNAKTFTSTVATGTAPLTVTSTTAVANLQAATATKLHTARAITVGPTAKNFDGSAAITYTLAEIGINVVTVCPTAAGTAGRVNIYTGAACATKYANWLYFET